MKLKTALARLPKFNALTLLGLSDADREFMAIAASAVKTESERDHERAVRNQEAAFATYEVV